MTINEVNKKLTILKKLKLEYKMLLVRLRITDDELALISVKYRIKNIESIFDKMLK